MGTFAARFGRNLVVNTTAVLTAGVSAFAVYVTTPRHTDPSISPTVVTPQWTTNRSDQENTP